MPDADSADLDLLAATAREAGTTAMRFFRRDPRQWIKDDDSPVTEADITIDRFLRDELTTARPDYGWLSEESLDNASRMEAARVFIVDPIDGTRAFMAGEEGWVISIAIVESGIPLCGVLFDPVRDELWSARRGGGAFVDDRPLHVGDRAEIAGAHIAATQRAVRVAGLASMQDSFRRTFTKSLARRIALVARGDFDAALAASSPSDWDIAAAVLLVEEAGGVVSELTGAPLRFNRSGTRQPALIAAGQPLHAAITAAARRVGEATEAT